VFDQVSVQFFKVISRKLGGKSEEEEIQKQSDIINTHQGTYVTAIKMNFQSCFHIQLIG